MLSYMHKSHVMNNGTLNLLIKPVHRLINPLLVTHLLYNFVMKCFVFYIKITFVLLFHVILTLYIKYYVIYMQVLLVDT